MTNQNKIFVVLAVLVIHFAFLRSKLNLAEFSSIKTSEPEVIKLKVKRRPTEKKKDLKQIVNTQQRKKREEPAKDVNYLGQTNQKFDRQTVAKKNGKFKEAGKGGEVDSKDVAKTTAKQKKIENKSRKRGKLDFADLAPKTFTPEKYKNQPSKRSRKGIQNGRDDLTGLAQNNDYVDDIPMSDMTRLNTQEYKYYGFYHRIRQRLEQYWEKQLRQKVTTIHKTGRSIASEQDKITSLRVVLDNKGNIVDIVLKGSSGIKEFDDAAIESFNQAGPFPNPPRGMVRGGEVTLEWGFVVRS